MNALRPNSEIIVGGCFYLTVTGSSFYIWHILVVPPLTDSHISVGHYSWESSVVCPHGSPRDEEEAARPQLSPWVYLTLIYHEVLKFSTRTKNFSSGLSVRYHGNPCATTHNNRGLEKKKSKLTHLFTRLKHKANPLILTIEPHTKKQNPPLLIYRLIPVTQPPRLSQ